MRSISILLLLIGTLSVSFSTQAQDQPPRMWNSILHIEGGFYFPRNAIREDLAIRQTVSYAYPAAQGQVTAMNRGFNTALKWEKYHRGLRIGFTTGIRYSALTTDITGSVANNINYFYLRYGEDGPDARFARVTSITEATHFLGLPLEITYAPIERLGAKYFVRAGLEPIYRLKNNTQIHFHNPEMENHQEDVATAIPSPLDALNAKFYGAVGLSINRNNRFSITLEALFASGFLQKEAFSLTYSEGFSGFRVSYGIPVKK
jgi:hypothetical protein